VDLAEARRLWTTYDRHLRDDPYPAFAILREHGPVEGAIAFRALLTAFPQLTLAVPAEDRHVRPSLLLRSFAEVPVRPSSKP
jgi:hypothetical protein